MTSCNDIIKITAIKMQYNLSGWTIYVPFIECKALNIFTRAKRESNGIFSNLIM